MNSKFKFNMLLLLFLFAATRAQQGLQVNTTEGVVEGSRGLDGSYFAYWDIPYAGPTAGVNRFKAPTPPSKYDGVFHAINSNTICAQPSPRGLIGVENCLTLSIYTKNLTASQPVFVWLNVEDYASTTTPVFSYKRIVEEDIVFVTLNFRVSIFGFLCMGVEEAPGNAGLKDILQGLTWIKKNIAGFGGDPNNIVLIGHGSGAALADLITMSPRSKDLVHKAITLSGSALAPWAVAYNPVRNAEELGKKLSYENEPRHKLGKLFQTTNTDILIGAIEEFKFTNGTLLFAPCIENSKLNPNETVISDAPINILRSGKYNHIPYIAGFTTREGTIRAPEIVTNKWLEKMQANFSEFLPADINVKGNETAVKEIRKFYFADRPIDIATVEDYLDYFGDNLILVSTIKSVKERAATSTKPVRLLEFGYRGTLNSDWPYNQIPLHGVKHGGFLNYLFNYDLRPSDVTVMDSFVKRLTRFAYTGEPINSNTISVVWLPADKYTLNYLHYGGNDGSNFSATYGEEAKYNPHATRMAFWNQTYDRYYITPNPVSSSGKLISFIALIAVTQLFLQLLF